MSALRGRGRGRGRGLVQGGEERSFKEASKAIQENLKKHLENQEEGLFSDSDDGSDEGDGTEDLLSRLLEGYGGRGPQNELVSDAKELLKNAIRSSVCLICISSVKRADPIWSCDTCYTSFHINCIQRWAKDSIFQQKQQLEDDPQRVEKEKTVCWSCPKCRNSRPPSTIPQHYTCYCTKTRDPPLDPWQTPHSCGELCSRPLSGCAHKCLLLCHPGPCPPCPQTVSISCHCGQARPTVRRCSAASWACGGQCGQALGCGAHPCADVCHPGDCQPCSRTSVQSCECQKTRQPRPCSSPVFKCGTPCGSLLSCGYHSCDLICHPGTCPPCPLSLDRLCPCGKSTTRLPCTEATPTCGDTCGKVLACTSHNCSERCHRGNCPSCLQMATKECRCGAKVKEVQCARTFTCETKCKKTRDCQRHPCNKKCCPGSCPPCEQLCGKTLSCKNHKCLSRCHRGACYPCQATVQLSCNCGITRQVVPCGREKQAKPPRCRKPCSMASNCHHPVRDRHNCHPPPCPSCKQVCGQDLPCGLGHVCPASCHDNVQVKVVDNSKPVGPWEEKAPVFKVSKLPCPPCNSPVPVTCLGQHETCAWPCHLAKPAPCGRRCGRSLPCGNHSCARDCHKVRHSPDQDSAGINCKKCEEECQVTRPTGCPHPCSLPCHPPPCQTCTTNIKIKCHCGLTNLFRKCGEFLAASEQEKEEIFCCQDQCPKLMQCGHRCSKLCHLGDCSSVEMCKKKVKISCPCKRRKEEFRCSLAGGKENKVACDENCKEASKQAQKENLKVVKQKEEEELLKNQREAELFERRLEGGGKKRRRNRKTECLEEEPSFIVKHKVLLMGSVCLAVLSAVMFYVINME
eukprot:GFUD01039167.1.p1 GENE.GFUD01039167.1~~GFUD01039167.1.p1  ORF type:complete len:854 (+),score=216.27 GFUD01039167.1:347-2908(+)